MDDDSVGATKEAGVDAEALTVDEHDRAQTQVHIPDGGLQAWASLVGS
jgi:hypothetical protein